jgi:subtilase family serine protease
MGPWTAYQYSFAGTGARQTPDMSFDSDPASGMYVYDSDEGGSPWWIVGGTSLASPALAGIANASNDRAGQALPGGGKYTNREDNLVYAEYDLHLTYPNYFYDVTTGSNGTGHNAGTNYDQCTGIGSPRGHFGK